MTAGCSSSSICRRSRRIDTGCACVTCTTGLVGPLLTRVKTPVPLTAEEEMRGDGRQAVLSPDRQWLYTLYTHQPDHLHTRDLLAGARGPGRDHVHAFVHTLNLNEGWAFCLDLPAPFGLGPASAHALALAPDGRRLFVADWTSSQVAVADTMQLQVMRAVELSGMGPIAGSAAAGVAPDGKRVYLAGGAAVIAVDSYSLAADERWTVGADTLGLAISADGARLYLGQPGHVLQLASADGKEQGRLRAPDLTGVRRVIGLTT